MMGSAKAHYEGIKAFSEADQTEDLKAITVPTLVLQGEDDQVVRSCRSQATVFEYSGVEREAGGGA
jgi:alpha-beta hydrolase superfamily lysophospholipase